MKLTALHVVDGRFELYDRFERLPAGGWVWVDVELAEPGEAPHELFAALDLDELAVHDAFNEFNLPKFDDFGDHLLLVLHGLRDDERVTTYEIDCFISERALVTVHLDASPAVEALWTAARSHPQLLAGGCGEVAARLADGLTRRLLAVVDAFDVGIDDLIARALVADRRLLNDVAAARADVAAVRRVVHPQRETLDLVRTSETALLSDRARRRFSDVFDVASRTAYGLDASRSALAETVDAYRGAEARSATEVSRVLTIYAAVLLPLSLIVGFFGMNHANLPTIDRRWGWIAVAGLMVVLTALSIGVFVAQGWITRPSGRRAGATLGQGLVEAARAPAQVAGAVFAISTLPLKAGKSLLGRPGDDEERID
ncbi:MAG: magnesium transporter CorA family protein [Ilumatobacter sp.]|nr:magnesium transporter CorA family protein [Ilumatobacter sp.]